jgi:3-hydroxyacyl-[acyl-carrier-protein] dehydratase
MQKVDGIEGAGVVSRLAHKRPYLFIESIVKHNKGEGVECKMTLDGSEPYFAGHFPGHPILPGVFEVEAMFQASEIFIVLEDSADDESGGNLMLTKIMSAKFQKPIYPPGSFVVSVLLKKTDGNEMKFRGSIYNDTEKYAECSFVITIL